MNHRYRLIFNRARNRWVVASELAASHSRSGTRTVSSARASAKLAGVAVMSLLLPLEALAECKKPWEWVNEGLLFPAGKPQQERTPNAGYAIDWLGEGTPVNTGTSGRAMPFAWLDHYCENNPPTPANQNLTVNNRAIYGGNGSNATLFGTGGNGGRGGDGGNIFLGVLSDNGRIAVNGDGVYALKALSRGGDGGNGGNGGSVVGSGGSGGLGGNGGTVAMLNVGNLSTGGKNAPAMSGTSEGGTGGRGGSGGWAPWSNPGGGKPGGNSGSAVNIVNLGTLNTSGNASDGIFGNSVGGNGGAGGVRGSTLGLAIGGNGGGGGTAGLVQVQNRGSITTKGAQADAISAQAFGGGGGDGGLAVILGITASVAIGGDAGSGGDSGHVDVVNTGALSTSGKDAMGIRAQTIGGGGGNGGSSFAAAIGPYFASSTAIGGKGGDGGKGGLTRVYNLQNGSIVTGAALAEKYRKATRLEDLEEIDVLAPNWKNLDSGMSHGIFAQSIGGGGGSGGTAISAALAVGNEIALSSTVSLGGSGGGGGTGGPVEVYNQGASISTYDRFSNAILAQSVGGGGGSGGDTLSVAAAVTPGQLSGEIAVNIGGAGGSGGHGDRVQVDTGTALSTWGAGSTAVLAQSVGGGGGNAGSILDVGVGFGSSAFKIGVNLGRSGGNGGNGSTVLVNPNMATAGTAITTLGDNATGIRAQSVGGGGGSGSSIKSYAISLQQGEGVAGTATLNLGGTGGSGGLGGAVTVNYNGRMETNGAHAQGILAQSIGGGGGAGGNILAVSVAASLNSNAPGNNKGGAFTGNVNLGGTGGSGNHAGGVSANVGASSSIVTAGMRSPGLMVQSVGGGGGQGGNTHSFSIASSLPSKLAGSESTLAGVYGGVKSLFVARAQDAAKKEEGQTSLNLTVNVGGLGGAAGSGGSVWAGVSGNISTTGAQSHGVFAQSIGGGGGSGGSAFTTGIEGVGGHTVGVSMGGAGGGGGSAAPVLVGIQSTPAHVSTQGESAHGILAQSIGGGGGEGGVATVAFMDPSFMSKKSYAFSMGGRGGTAGNGSTVRVFNAATVSTRGANANGIVAQSIGGGGGVAGSTGTAAALINVGLGGDGASAGNGGDVHVGHFAVSTMGDSAIGVLAQSIGGGGGLAGIGETGRGTVQLSVGVGGKGGSAGHGGIVNVGCLGDYTNVVGCARSVSTSGKVAHGIMAQSIGGGGGLTQGTKISPVNDPTETADKFDINLGSFGMWKGTTNGNSSKVSVYDFGGSRFDIRTSGAGAIGLIAQSLSGGGGALSLNRDKKSNQYAVSYSNNIQIEGNGTGTNGGVDIYLAGSIVTTGAYAHGIFAQSLAGSQTVFGNDGVDVFGGLAAANGRIDIKTAATTNINVSGAGAHGIVSMTNLVASSSSQWLQLFGQIRAAGSDSWALKASNGFLSDAKTSVDALLAVDAYGTITGGKAGAGAVRIENYNGGVSSLYVQPGGKVTTDRTTASKDCPATGCYVVSMFSNRRNNLLIMEGGVLSGGIVGLDTFDGAQGNFVTVNGSLSSLPNLFGQTDRYVYEQPVIQVSHGWTEIAVGSKGSIAGTIDIPYVGGKITNDGMIWGRINAFNSNYTNNGRHLMSIPGTGGAGLFIDVVTLNNNASKGDLVVELLSLPSGSFQPMDLIKASSMSLGRGVTGLGTATKLDLVQTANKVTLNGARVDFAVRGMPPGLAAAADIATDQANSGSDGNAGGGAGGGFGGIPDDASDLYDLLLDMANEPDIEDVIELLDNFSVGYSDAALTLGAAWYAANHLQSCGDNQPATTSAIEQGNCSWTRLTYDDMELGNGAQKGRNLGISAGWQHEFREHVYVGLSAGYANTDFANVRLAQSEGERFTLGGIVKYVNGNVFGAASMIGAFSMADGERAISVPGLQALARSERETWLLSTRLRGGYEFVLRQGFSLTPSMELNVPLVHDEGYRERGGGEFNLEVLSSTNVVPDVYPALQLSKQFTVGETSLRGWLEAGKRVRFGEFETDVRMPDGFAPESITPISFDPGKTSTVLSTGFLIEWSERLEARVLYEQERGGGMKSQSGSVKLAWKI